MTDMVHELLADFPQDMATRFLGRDARGWLSDGFEQDIMSMRASELSGEMGRLRQELENAREKAAEERHDLLEELKQARSAREALALDLGRVQRQLAVQAVSEQPTLARAQAVMIGVRSRPLSMNTDILYQVSYISRP